MGIRQKITSSKIEFYTMSESPKAVASGGARGAVLMLQFREIMFINEKTKPSDFQMLYKTIKKNLFITSI